MRIICIVMLAYMLVTLGVSPDLHALTIPSAGETRTAGQGPFPPGTDYTLSAHEALDLMGSVELARYMSDGRRIYGGGYYGTTANSNQYSSFFGGVEDFIYELLEFFLFLAMISYIIGYEEWLPWEEKDPDK